MRAASILFLLMIICVASCRKVISLDLRESDTKYVIEGIITNEAGKSGVYISQSKPFYEDNNFPGISGAVVTIKDNGVEFRLEEDLPGIYKSMLLNGAPGHRYELSVTINGQEFTAVSIMPQPVFMDTMYISRGPFGQFSFATIGFKDPANIGNGYRFVQYVNGVQEPTIFWENDELSDGDDIVRQLDVVAEKDDPRSIHSGDEVTVEMQTIDEAVFLYWYSLNSGGGDGSINTAAPANPVTNINGGALGYFSAHTVDRRTVIAP